MLVQGAQEVLRGQPDRDAFDLVNEIDADQRRLGELNGELQAAMRLKVEARVKLVEADAGVSAARAEIDILKARLMAKMSLLRALPR